MLCDVVRRTPLVSQDRPTVKTRPDALFTHHSCVIDASRGGLSVSSSSAARMSASASRRRTLPPRLFYRHNAALSYQFRTRRSGGMADAPDSKSGRGNPVRVQVPPPAPQSPTKNPIDPSQCPSAERETRQFPGVDSVDAGNISDLTTTGTAPEHGISAPMSM